MYEQKGKIMRIARFSTRSGSLERYAGRLSRKTGHVYSVIGRMQVQKNWTSPRVPRPERLSWDKLYRRFWAFLIMESMWEFHFKSLETLRSSILALATNSIGMPSTTTGLKGVVFLVLKFMRSPLHFVSFSWNFSEEARVDQGVDGGLDVTVLVLAYCLRDGRIVDVFPEIVGKNIKLVDHHDGQPWPQIFVPWETPAGTTPHS